MLLENIGVALIMRPRMTSPLRLLALFASLALAACQSPKDPAANVSDPYASNYNDGHYNPYPGQSGRADNSAPTYTQPPAPQQPTYTQPPAPEEKGLLREENSALYRPVYMRLDQVTGGMAHAAELL